VEPLLHLSRHGGHEGIVTVQHRNVVWSQYRQQFAFSAAVFSKV
jgi:hypothetical protein